LAISSSTAAWPRSIAPLRWASVVASCMNGRYSNCGDARSASCVIALSFGYRLGTDGVIVPGKSNERLAQFIVERYLDKPVIAQYEIALAIEAQTGRRIDRVIGGRPEADARYYLGTREVLARSAAMMKSMALPSALIVAHPFHVARAKSMAKSLGIQAAVPPGLPEVWDSKSHQTWTRSPRLWRARELPTLLMFTAMGWLS
jgi:hypothetical protein